MNGAVLVVVALVVVAIFALGAVLLERHSGGEPGMRRMDTMRQNLGRATTERDVMRNNPSRPAEVRDPVCGIPLSGASTTAKVVYRGRTYCFCSTQCARAFERGESLWRER